MYTCIEELFVHSRLKDKVLRTVLGLQEFQTLPWKMKIGSLCCVCLLDVGESFRGMVHGDILVNDPS